MPATKSPFSAILFGFAFSPTLEANIMETNRLATLLRAKLILLHVGNKTTEKEQRVLELLKKVEFPEQGAEVHWQEGKPVEVILEATHKFHIDLLVLGAMQHENVYQFYVGSIARKLTRKVNCSVLLLIKPSTIRVPCQHIVVNGLDAPETPLAITSAFYFARALGAKQVTIVEEIRQKEVSIAIEDDASLKKAALLKEKIKKREDSRVQRLLEKIPEETLKGVKVKTQSIFGQRGYSIGHYAEVVRADLLVMNAPEKSGIMDRIFTHDIEYILSDLPTDLLIIRPPH